MHVLDANSRESAESNPFEGLILLTRKFTPKNVVTYGKTQHSMQKRVRNALRLQYPMLSEHELSEILPRETDSFRIVKCHARLSLITVDSTIFFFQYYNGLFIPHLRLLHQYPFMLPRMQCDAGGCKHILRGSNVMCPGLTSSQGGEVTPNLPKRSLVRIDIDGKTHAIGIGSLTMSSASIVQANKGVAINTIHVMGDGLWHHHHL